MEKKKLVKPIVIAASVAAVVGIGAVSFAAWNAGGKEITVPGGTGTVATAGITLLTNNLAAEQNNVLVPYNQNLDNSPITDAGKTAVKVWQITLVPNSDVASDYTVKITDNGSAVANTALKVFVGESWSAPTGDSLSTTDFKAIGADTAAITPISNVIYIVLDSGVSSDMGKALSIKIELNET